MKKYMSVSYAIVIATVFLWIGFVCAISFMEAWLKFQAPGITLPLGLGIGKLVFAALNKVELLFSVVIIGSMFMYGFENIKTQTIFFVIAFIILLLQSIYMLPHLDARAELVIQGQAVPSSNLHFYYIGVEVIKVVCLIVFGIQLLKHKTSIT